ncbi:acyl-CoA carboxylase subunit beta [Schlesneria paludicola]|uniref:acyl-CoA carboxylase subunit beta n=1 Tax=Schlesneria paludicola TaxID=360056 RepID=UPI000299ED9E|nr:acyl-CoA carboxylase subunit beta [Schlesneria paludicola]
MARLSELTMAIEAEQQLLREGTGATGIERQHRQGRLAVRERLAQLLDDQSLFHELGLWAAWGMYPEWGEIPAAGVVVGIGQISGHACMIVANDATVKAGAMFPQSVKKVLRAQKIAELFRLPVVYLVDSAGVFLPLQDEIFPDEDDFGRIFRNNARMSAAGIPQIAAVMGYCVAGGAYLPVLCDILIMTEGSQMYLAGPALVKAAIGQTVDPEELGGAAMHSRVSGTADFHEPNDQAALARVRKLVAQFPAKSGLKLSEISAYSNSSGNELFDIVSAEGHAEYDVRRVLACLVDGDSIQEYKAEYGQALVTSFARIGGHPVGIVANQHCRSQSARGEFEFGGVVYPESAEKAARFVANCNQDGIPLIFLQDVVGFMVGRAAEQSGIIRAGAKLVNVVSNSIVPKLTVILGGSFGAGNYALCGKAYDPWLILAWPNARYAVMGAQQAAETLLTLRIRDAERTGKKLDEHEVDDLRRLTKQNYENQTDIRYAAARGWVDAIISPLETRHWLHSALELIAQRGAMTDFRTGIWQV